MEMAEVMTLIETERLKRGLSAERFANEVGITSTTYSRQKNGTQHLGIDTLQRYAQYAKRVGNIEVLRALAAFAIGLDPEQISIESSK